jgi:hypothetical protein
MLLVRDAFRCRPAQVKAVAETRESTIPWMERDDGFRDCRVLVDLVASYRELLGATGSYWTVMLQAEVEDLAAFERHGREFGARREVRTAMHGDLDLALEGYGECGGRDEWSTATVGPAASAPAGSH